MTDEEQDAVESERVAVAARRLAEDFDAVVIICSRHEGIRGTRSVSRGSGNWHTQYGMVREWLQSRDEYVRIGERHLNEARPES